MKTLLINNQTKHVEAWRSLLEEHGSSLDVLPFNEADKAEEKYDLIILSGGTNLAVPLNREVLAKEMDLVRASSTPILGICLGAEIITEAFGGILEYREERKTGIRTVHVIKDDPIFGNLRNFDAKMAHKYYMEDLPKDLEALARSDSGIDVFKHKTKPIYGFQFHPEIISPENQGTQVFLNLLKQL